MLHLGFRVKELIGGLDCWRHDGYLVEGLQTAQPAGSCGCFESFRFAIPTGYLDDYVGTYQWPIQRGGVGRTEQGEHHRQSYFLAAVAKEARRLIAQCRVENVA